MAYPAFCIDHHQAHLLQLFVSSILQWIWESWIYTLPLLRQQEQQPITQCYGYKANHIYVETLTRISPTLTVHHPISIVLTANCRLWDNRCWFCPSTLMWPTSKLLRVVASGWLKENARGHCFERWDIRVKRKWKMGVPWLAWSSDYYRSWL